MFKQLKPPPPLDPRSIDFKILSRLHGVGLHCAVQCSHFSICCYWYLEFELILGVLSCRLTAVVMQCRYSEISLACRAQFSPLSSVAALSCPVLSCLTLHESVVKREIWWVLVITPAPLQTSSTSVCLLVYFFTPFSFLPSSTLSPAAIATVGVVSFLTLGMR